MITGELPFQGPTVADVVASILKEKPRQIEGYLPQPPPMLEGVLLRCLQKDPDKRYQSFEELVLDLKRLQQEIAPKAEEKKSSSRWPADAFRKILWRAFSTALILGILGAILYLLVPPMFFGIVGNGARVSRIPSILESDFDAEVLSNPTPVVVFAYPDSSGLMATDAPTANRVLKEYGSRLKMIKFETGLNDNLKNRLKVSDPALIFFDHGMERGRLSGAFSWPAAMRLIEDGLKASQAWEPAPRANVSPTPEPVIEPLENLAESDFGEKVLEAKEPVLLFIGQTFDGAYDPMKSALQAVAARNKGQVRIYYLETRANEILASRLRCIEGVHLLLYESGRLKRKLDGNASEEAIARLLANKNSAK